LRDQETDGWKFLIMWEFRPRPGAEKQFEEAYGPDGSWARLFALDREFVATELIRDLKDPGCYLTVDLWASKAAYEKFREEYAAEYQDIDAKCEALTSEEKELGVFERLGS
jgi:hypothetical protein